MPLSVCLFGPPQIRAGEEVLPPPRTRKALSLLALLALNAGRDLDRIFLAGTLWPESDAEHGATNLRQALAILRHSLGPESDRIYAGQRQYLRLDLDQEDFCDAARFDAEYRHWETSREVATAESAANLYSGPLLDGWEDEWLLSHRAREAKRAMALLEFLARSALDAGDAAGALRWLGRAAEFEPLNQPVQRLLYTALARSGDLPAARRAFRDFRLRLRDEMGGEPDAETQALMDRLRSDAGLDRVRPTRRGEAANANVRLPQFFTPLVGRTTDVEAVTGRLADEARLLTLTGIGGAGKTRLAVAVGANVAEILPELAPDGVYFVDLAPLKESDAADTQGNIGEIVLRALCIEDKGGAPEEVVARWARERAFLLLLDNCEHVLAPCQRLAHRLLASCPGLRVLATSRQPLGVPGEQVWPVPLLPLAEAARLFRARVGAVAPGVDCGDEVVERICRMVEGLPLAVELAAAWAAVLPLSEIESHLWKCLATPGGSSAVGPERQHTLWRTLEWSYTLLTESERALLRRLSVFIGGWTLPAAEAVCDAALADIAALVHRALIRRDGDRYRMLEMVRQFAAEKRDAEKTPDQLVRLRNRHRDWCLALANEAAPQLRGPEMRRWLTRLDTERANTTAALDWCAQTADDPAMPAQVRQEAARIYAELAMCLRFYWQVQTAFEEGCGCLKIALRLGESFDLPLRERVRLRTALAHITEVQGDREAVERLCEEGLRLCADMEENDASPLRAELLTIRGTREAVLGNFAEGEAILREALALHRAAGNFSGAAENLDMLGYVARSRGDDTEADRILSEAIALSRRAKDFFTEVSALGNRGCIAVNAGDYRLALATFRKTLFLQRQIGNRGGEAWNLAMLGVVRRTQGRLYAARVLMEGALRINLASGRLGAAAWNYRELGQIARLNRDWKQARHWLEQALDMNRRMGEEADIAYVLLYLAQMEAASGNAEAAREQFGQAYQLGKRLGMEAFAADVARAWVEFSPDAAPLTAE